jgi:hypothetical protein
MEKHKLQKLFEMGSGYVLGDCFTNASFQGFVLDVTEKNIYDKAYHKGSNSKANLLRGFWEVEPNHVVGKLLAELVEVVRRTNRTAQDDPVFIEGERIVRRLLQNAPVPEIAAITFSADDRDFEMVAKSVRDAIDRNEPESRLDHLHTLAVKYLRSLCRKHGISVDMGKPLHSLMGEYVKKVKEKGLLESDMTERILRSHISVFDEFCSVRDDQSLAHDNPVLNYEESVLIFNYVTSAIRFIRAIESKADKLATPPEAPPVVLDDDVPF